MPDEVATNDGESDEGPQEAVPGDPTTISIQDHFRRAAGAGRDDERVETDEEVWLWSGSFSWKAMFREAALALFITVGLLVTRSNIADPQVNGLVVPIIGGMWLFVVALLVYRKWDASYTVTSQRLLHKHGILYRRTHRIETIDIDDLRYEQGIFEQLLNIGRIIVHSSDASHDDLVMYGIDRVGNVFDILEQARRRERLQHGLHIEAI